MADVGNYPFRQAAHYTRGRTARIKWIVMHDMETGETSKTAETVAAMFADPNSRVASAHLCIDNDSVIRCVHDADTAYHAPGANNQGLGIEHAGRASQNRTEWLDAFGKAMLERSAIAAAAWAHAYGIPVVKLSPADLVAGKAGFCGHVDVTNAFHRSTHTDPGPNFPWDYYLQRVKAHLSVATQAAAAPTPLPAHPRFPLHVGHWFGPPSKDSRNHSGYYSASDRQKLAIWQHQMAARGWHINTDGRFSPQTSTTTTAFQREKHLPVTGRVDVRTWDTAWTAPRT